MDLNSQSQLHGCNKALHRQRVETPRRILSFTPISNHRGDTIGKQIESSMLDWGLDKIFVVAVDNASANDVAINYLKRKLRNWKDVALVLDGEFMHVRCCAHILNLIVSDGLKEIHTNIISIRNAVKFVRSSSLRLQAFQEACAREKIDYNGNVILDVPTRWNSTYMMLATALRFQKAFKRMVDDDDLYVNYFTEEENRKRREGPPITDDWDNAERFVAFLETFYDATLKFSASLSVTSNICFNEICKIHVDLTKLSQSEDPLLGTMSLRMKMKYDKYWESTEKINKMIIIATILDPQRKLQFATLCFDLLFDEDQDKVEEMKMATKDLLYKLYEEYSAWYGTTGSGGPSGDGSIGFNAPTATGAGGVGSSQHNGDDATSLAIPKMKHNVVRKRKDPWQQWMDNQKGTIPAGELHEVERYLLDQIQACNEDFNILMWWKCNSSRYPILARLAKDVLAFPVSTVASESAFSTGGRILDQFRSSLTPKMVKGLICTQNWIRASLLVERIKADEVLVQFEDTEFYQQIEADFARLCTTQDPPPQT